MGRRMVLLTQASPSPQTGQSRSSAELLAPIRQALATLAADRQRAQEQLEESLRELEGAIQRALAQALAAHPVPAAGATSPLAATPPRLGATAAAMAAASPTAATPAAARGSAAAAGLAEPADGSGASGAASSVRARLLEIHSHLVELDRLLDPEAILKKLWAIARAHGLRAMTLNENGRSLAPEQLEGFDSLDGSRLNRLRKTAIPFDPDGLFAIVANEKGVYSGPRPITGFPVDLALLLGKRAPAWILLLPFPHRNRWGRFLYLEADAAAIEGALLLDPIARFALRQMRAAQFHRHQPAEKLRALMESTLLERRRRLERAALQGHEASGAAPGDAAASATPETRAAVPSAASASGGGESAAAASGAAGAVSRPTGSFEGLRLERDVYDEHGREVRQLQAAEILGKIGELPAMPHVAGRVLSMLSNPETPIASLQGALGQDQALAAKLLQIANSSLYGGTRECATIGEAIVRLGFSAIRSWILATATRSVFMKGETSYLLRILWQHSVIGALAAQLVAERTGRMDPDEAFVGGLMHNVGLLLLARNHPKVMSELHQRASADCVGYHVLERKLLGYDHADLGGIVLQSWHVGDRLISAVAAHHRLGQAGSSRDFAAIVALGEELALRMGRGPTEASHEDLSRSEPARALGLDAAAMDDISARLAQLLLDGSLFA
jgi:HD-like signal output (HDOD) protein